MMMRFLTLAALAIAGTCAHAFHVQIGFSGKSAIYDKAINNGALISPQTNTPFRSWTNEVGQTASYLASYSTCGYNSIGCVEGFETESASGPEGVYVVWDNPDRPDRVTLSEAWATSGKTTITIGETVNVPAFGYVYEPYVDYRLFNGVFTCRGNPYSDVLNDTSVARTVNGVRIAPGESASLIFPIHLKTAEIPNVRFYDIESGVELTPYDYASYGQSGKYYNNGYYTLGYTGNIRISDGTGGSATNHPPAEPLVFGSFVTTNEYKILYAENDMPVYADGVVAMTNIALMTWWDFSHSDWGTSPKAKINDDVVCGGHSTSHIIDYTVSVDGMRVYDGMGYFDFSMSQEPQSGYSGGSCTMRCWDKSQGSTTSAYTNTPAEHKAEVSAGTGAAWFRVKIDTRNGTWEVYPL